MIDRIETDQVHLTDNGVLLKCGPVTLEALASSRDADALTEGDEAFTRLFVNDTGITLCAFSSSERRDLFDSLLKVKGVGMKTAILVLELGERSDVLRAATSEDTGFFKQVPGLGKTRLALVFEALSKLPCPPPTDIPVADWVEARERAGGGDQFDVALQGSGLTLEAFLQQELS